MYKRFSIKDLTTIHNDFIPHLYALIKRERCQWANDFFKLCFHDGSDVYYFSRWDICFRISKRNNELHLADEIDKIEVVLPFDQKSAIQSLIIKYVSKKERQFGQKTIEQILMDEFKTGKYSTINWKPYVVYDIETTVVDDLKAAEFLLAYAMYPNGEKMDYRAIMRENLRDFVDEMLAFDWYIVWFNSIWFDNPISVRNAWYWDKEIEILNQKSIDLYVFFQKLTKKRIWLNKLSDALVWVQKTLTSWAEWEVLWNEYMKTWDVSFLEGFKKYCKNDVRLTALVMFYFLHYQKIFIDDEEFVFTMDDFMKKSNYLYEDEDNNPAKVKEQTIF